MPMMTVAEAAEMLGAAPDAMMTREEVAEFLKVAPRTLADWEKEGRGPPAARIGPRKVVYSKNAVTSYLASLTAASQTAKAPRPLTKAEREAHEQALHAERRRCIAIMNRAPKGYQKAVMKAIADNTSIEDFDASLPGELRAVMPPLHRFLADLDRPKDYAAEATAQAILASHSLASK
ncbi:helix-turn-helix transcriptional regulator [Microvirga calopogonii]|uniref:helix-turn-helix transcriptional regulator n=1 Tax=Microvirga calopogonii TaxID=2078013 RepID=UPI0013B3F28D|nr:helix-turn-helix domain-containing protein [Microvirga calopogonii]